MNRLLTSNYVIVKLDVLESDDKKNLEHPGGIAVMEQLGGKNAGLPFMAIVDPAGKMLINSLDTKTHQNVGYPAAPNEIAHFIGMMKSTAPRLKDADRMKMQTWLQQNAPKPGGG